MNEKSKSNDEIYDQWKKYLETRKKSADDHI